MEKLSKDEINFFVGNREEVEVRRIGDILLKLESVLLKLKDTILCIVYVQNLISVSKLDICVMLFLFTVGSYL